MITIQFEEENGLIGVEQAMEISGLKEKTLRNYVFTGRVSGLAKRGIWLNEESLREYLRKRTKRGQQKLDFAERYKRNPHAQEILRLRVEGKSIREIARELGIPSHQSVGYFLKAWEDSK